MSLIISTFAALGFTVGLGPTCVPRAAPLVTMLEVSGLDELPKMYKQRWAGADQEERKEPVAAPLYRSAATAKWTEQKEICIEHEKETICGSASFDSRDDGMVCVADPESSTLKWICA